MPAHSTRQWPALRDQTSLDPLSASQTYSAIGKLYAGHEQWKEAAKAYAQADNGIWGGYSFRGFVTELVTAGKYDAIWEAYRGAFPGHNWQLGDPAVPAIPIGEIAKAAYQGKLLVQGGAQSLVCGLDCQVNTQNPLKIPFGQFIELADFAPVAPPTQGCGTDPMFAVEFRGGQWLTMARQLTFQLAFDSSPIRPLPAERPALAVGIGISGGLGQSAGQSAPGQLPPLTELALGLQGRASAVSGGLYTGDPEVRAVAADVFRHLLDTPVRRAGPSEPYELSLLNSPSVNAFSTAAGKVYVDSGLLSYVGKDPGMWAAVLSHEIGHCVGQHQYHAYMRLYELQRLKAYYAWRMALGDKTATWFYLGTKIGGDLLNMKLSRDEESEADRTGLMMMAEAGYHPDFILALFDRLRDTTGDRSRLVTFFSSDHPRWNTREQRTAKTMDQAIEVFESRWKDPAESPGGMPPAITILETPKASIDKNAKLVRFSVPYGIRHAAGSSATVALVFQDHGKAVAAADSNFRTADGHLGIVKPLDVTLDRVSSSLDVSIPASAVDGKNRKLDVKAVLTRNGKIERETPAITVSFPKP
jgi:Zn-dependent protease with chaperone function